MFAKYAWVSCHLATKFRAGQRGGDGGDHPSFDFDCDSSPGAFFFSFLPVIL